MKRFLVASAIALLAVGCQSIPKTDIPQVEDNQLGMRAYEQNNHDLAVQHFNLWLTHHAEDADMLFARGCAYNKLKRYDLAQKDFSRAMALAPADLRPAIYLTGVLLAQRQVSQAQQILEAVLANPAFARSEMDPYHKFLALELAAELKLERKEYREALEYLESAVALLRIHHQGIFADLSDHYRTVLYNRAIVYYRSQQYDKAANDFKELIELAVKAGEPVEQHLYKHVVLALYLANNLEKSRKFLPYLNPQDREDVEYFIGSQAKN